MEGERGEEGRKRKREGKRVGGHTYTTMQRLLLPLNCSNTKVHFNINALYSPLSVAVTTPVLIQIPAPYK